ncbi:PKD domain-containing protein [Halorientalis salina]|uniref:PKD domain-containing protein n=1 Tax=Halorientalis salina TaxID=2932266 RepID=UPI00145FCC68|nr:PKD domain-containing protein [Halorientalis salina]
MYNRKRVARGAGTAIAVWALLGLFIVSTGVAYALPLAGVGGFTITADEVQADNLLLYPGVGDTSERDAYPQTIAELEGTTITDLTASKTIGLDSTPGLSGKFRVSIVSQGESDGSALLLKSSALQSSSAEFTNFSIEEMASDDPRGRFELESNGPVTLGGTGQYPVRIRAHYVALNSVSTPNLGLRVCYDPDNDDEYEYGSCDGSLPDWGSNPDMGENQAPKAVAFAEPIPAEMGETITFDASSSYDPDGSVESYEWSFSDGTTTNGKTATRSYSSTGDYEVTLTVTDDDGKSGSDTVTVTVGNQAPTADASADKTTVIPDETVTFDGSGSSDPDGSIESYEWDFGDGTTAVGESRTHSYDSTGTYTATLNVSDDLGISDTDTIDIDVVQNEPPTASASVDDAEPNPGETVTFDASESSDDTGRITSYEWEFGDGTTATGDTPTHAYSSPGTYEATVTVTDSGGLTETETVTVDVNEVPTASFTRNPTSGNEDTTFTFNASGSSDPDGSIVSYEWSLEEDDWFDNSATASGEVIEKQFEVVDIESTKTFDVTLTVTDDNGATDSVTKSVDVDNCYLDIC